MSENMGGNFPGGNLSGWEFSGWKFSGWEFTRWEFSGWEFTGWEFSRWEFSGHLYKDTPYILKIFVVRKCDHIFICLYRFMKIRDVTPNISFLQYFRCTVFLT